VRFVPFVFKIFAFLLLDICHNIIHVGRAHPEKPTPNRQKFFASFFQKRRPFFRSRIRVSKETR
jgi:hypothetical protein